MYTSLLSILLSNIVRNRSYDINFLIKLFMFRTIFQRSVERTAYM